MDLFNDFWTAYPNPTGIGAARRAWGNQIFFAAADQEQMVRAAKAFRLKHTDTDKQFIPYPAKWLTDQVYLDDELNPKPVEAREKREGWQANFTEETDKQFFTFAQVIDNILYLAQPVWQIERFKNNYSTELRISGIKDVKEKPR